MGRRTYRKGSRSRTRRGHKNFETYKGSKRYKRKFGRKTGRAPFFPFAGGTRKSQDKIYAIDAVMGGSRMRHSYRRRPHFRTHRHKKRSHYNRRHSHRNRKHKRSKKQKKSRGLFAFLFS